jgi:uncharacterized RDD family membrane protein YckC
VTDGNVEESRGDLAATLGQRTLGRVIDFLIVSSVIVALGGATVRSTESGEVEFPRWVILVLATSYFLYETLSVAIAGKTVGKHFTRTALVSVRDGSRPQPVQAAVRALVAVAGWVIAPGLGVILLVAVYATAVFDRRQLRGLPDRLAGTAVVQRG